MMETKNKYKMTEIGEIPVDWEDTNFLNVFKPIPTKKYQIPNKDILDSGCYEVVDQGRNGIAGYSNQTEKLFEDVPAIIYGDHTTIVKYRKKPFVLGADGTKLLKVKEHYNAEYCYYLLNHFNISPEGYKRHYSIVKEVKFPLTKNKKEQQKIAEILSTVDEQIEQTDQLIEKTKELKKGLMQQLLTKGINHTKFKNSELGEIPVEWAIEKLKDLSDNMYQGINTVADKIKYEEEGVQILQAKHITKERFNYSDARFVSNQTFEKYKNKFNPIVNDILLSNIGTIGKTVRVSEHRDILIAWNIFLIRPKHEIDSIYLLYIFKRLAEIDYYDKFLTGNATKFINKTIIENILVPKPPLKEQQKIADILSSVDEDIEGYEEEKAKYEELKKGLMQQLLTGKTRVKVD